MAVKHAAAGAGAGAALMALTMQTVTPLLEKFEGVKHVPYHDIVNVLTVCAGHTGPDVIVNKVYSEGECNALTEKDAQKAAAGVLKYSPQMIYHPMQLAAAISLSYNIGVEGYGKSSVAANFNAGDFQAGCSAILKYTYAGGKFSQGLANRRQQEYNLCVSTLTPKGLANAGISTSDGA